NTFGVSFIRPCPTKRALSTRHDAGKRLPKYTVRRLEMKIAIAMLFVSLLVVASAFGQGAKKPPCSDANTQAEMNICAGKEYKAADAILNRVYQKLVAMLEPGEHSQLK